MMNFKQVKEDRFKFLKSLYDAVNANSNWPMDMYEFGESIGFDTDNIEKIANYLTNENLIKPHGIGSIILISHNGIKEVEQALSHPDQPTEHFSPINIINIGQMHNSSIQQATTHSNQTLNISNETIEDLNNLVIKLNELVEKLELQSEDRSELKSDIQTLEAQAKSSRPKFSVVKEILPSVKRILESGATEALKPECEALGHKIVAIMHHVSMLFS